MRLRQIEVFNAIIQTGTISGAARLLNVSQPNVSRILNHTEQQLEFTLFHRSKSGLQLTSGGQRLLPEVKKIIDQLHVINQLADSVRTKTAHSINLGAAHACSQLIVVPTIMQYRKKRPSIHVDLITEHFSALQQAVLARELDFALIFGQKVDSALLAEPLYQGDMVAILPQTVTPPDSVSLQWLCQQEFLMMQPDDPLGHILHRALSLRTLMPKHATYIKTYSVIADMVVSGGGVGIVDQFTASRCAADVHVVPLTERLPFELTLISRRDEQQSKATLELKALFKQTCQHSQRNFEAA